MRILFKETHSNTYAAQGDTATGTAGYDIWLWNDDGSQDFLGFIKDEDMMGMAYYYQSVGDDVYVQKIGGSRSDHSHLYTH